MRRGSFPFMPVGRLYIRFDNNRRFFRETGFMSLCGHGRRSSWGKLNLLKILLKIIGISGFFTAYSDFSPFFIPIFIQAARLY